MSGFAVGTGDPAILQPPANEVPVTADGTHTPAWKDYYQAVADRLGSLPAAVRKGATDGSDAAAGDIGEYLTASGSGVPLTNNVQATVATLNLTPGDWDVSGGVTFHLTSVTATAYGAGIDALGQLVVGNATTTASGLWLLGAGPAVRRNVTAATAVHLIARAGFSAGTVLADGVISARRVR